MAGHNRHLAGKTNDIRLPIRGQTVVESGDLMLRNGETWGGMMGTGRSLDYYGYPIDEVSSSCKSFQADTFAYHSFIGIAMNGSKSGVTEDIACATSGMFRYPLQTGHSGVTTSNVTAGMKVSMATGTVAQQVRPGTSSVSLFIGYCAKTESGASFIDFFLRSKYGPAGQIDQ